MSIKGIDQAYRYQVPEQDELECTYRRYENLASWEDKEIQKEVMKACGDLYKEGIDVAHTDDLADQACKMQEYIQLSSNNPGVRRVQFKKYFRTFENINNTDDLTKAVGVEDMQDIERLIENPEPTDEYTSIALSLLSYFGNPKLYPDLTSADLDDIREFILRVTMVRFSKLEITSLDQLQDNETGEIPKIDLKNGSKDALKHHKLITNPSLGIDDLSYLAGLPTFVKLKTIINNSWSTRANLWEELLLINLFETVMSQEFKGQNLHPSIIRNIVITRSLVDDEIIEDFGRIYEPKPQKEVKKSKDLLVKEYQERMLEAEKNATNAQNAAKEYADREVAKLSISNIRSINNPRTGQQTTIIRR